MIVSEPADPRRCAHCGATNLGPQLSCLLCETPFPAVEIGPTQLEAAISPPAEPSPPARPTPTPKPKARERQITPPAGIRDRRVRHFLDGLSGQARGKRFPLSATLIAGRDKGCDIVLTDPLVSRNHALFQVQGQQLYVRDLGSANGTAVNGQTVKQLARLNSGDIITIGATNFRVMAV